MTRALAVRAEGDDVGACAESLSASVASEASRHRASAALSALAGVGVAVASVCVPALAPAGGFVVVVAALLAVSNVRSLRRVRLAALVSGARNELAQGHLGRAERLAEWIEGADKRGFFARPVASLRAEVALARGDLERATAGFDAALALGARSQDARDAAWIPMIRAERALARALSGDDQGALADAAAIRALVDARAFGPRIVATVGWVKRLLARAMLAELVVASRAGDMARLDALASSSRRVVLDGVPPRERTLFRALERMAKARAASVYRNPAERPRDEREAPPSEWVERVLPGAGAFVHARASAVHSAPRSLAAARAEAPAPRRFGAAARLTLLWVLVGVMVFAYQQAETPRSMGDASWGKAYVAAAVASLVILVGVFLGARGSRPRLRAANDAMVLAATDPTGAALTALEPRDLLIISVKALALGQIAFERADFRMALSHAETCVEALEKMSASGDASELRGMVFAARAVALAALAREDEARASASAIPAAFTGRSAALVHVDLLAALAGGRIEEARDVAEGISDHTPLDVRSELVADLLRASNPTGGVGLAEMARLRAELEDPDARAFVNAIAPGLTATVEEAAGAPADHAAGADERADAANALEHAEIEAEAEAEADAIAVVRSQRARAPNLSGPRRGSP